jgi:hypothetical protein
LAADYHRLFLLGNQLDALFCEIFPLVVLTGQQFHGKNMFILSRF